MNCPSPDERAAQERAWRVVRAGFRETRARPAPAAAPPGARAGGGRGPARACRHRPGRGGRGLGARHDRAGEAGPGRSRRCRPRGGCWSSPATGPGSSPPTARSGGSVLRRRDLVAAAGCSWSPLAATSCGDRHQGQRALVARAPRRRPEGALVAGWLPDRLSERLSAARGRRRRNRRSCVGPAAAVAPAWRPVPKLPARPTSPARHHRWTAFGPSV